MKFMESRYIYYIPLVVLLILALLFQVRFAKDNLQKVFQPGEFVSVPLELKPFNPTIKRVSAEAEQAGVRAGDQLLAINERAYTGDVSFYEPLIRARPGDLINYLIRTQQPDGTFVDKSVQVRLVPPSQEVAALGRLVPLVATFLVMPVFCLLLGFFVAFLRPRDPLAWLLLGLMLSFSQLADVSIVGWEPGLREVLFIYHIICASAWPLCMMLFGIYFPERLNLDRRFPFLKWLLIAPLLLDVCLSLVFDLGSLYHAAALESLYLLFKPYQKVFFILALVSISIFFAGLWHKYFITTDRDARRRLRLLLTGASISITPLFILVILGFVRGTGTDKAAPLWIFVPSLLLLSLFPLTMAYVIVVQRAMDVRVVIRQGVQYALARGGVFILQIIIIALVIFLAASGTFNAELNRPQRLTLVALGFAFVLFVRRVAERLRKWIDRRFFREAYNAELILSDLSENVRTMVETKPLIETVAQRIAESLHIKQVTFLLKENGAYRPAHALGYNSLPSVSFSERSALVRQLHRAPEPLLVYAGDVESWLHKTPGLDGERASLEKLDAQLLLPLNVKEKLPGFISLGPKQSEEPYSSTDLRLLQSVATQTGLALENSQLTAAIASEVAQRERLNREIEIAREVQERLFPQEFPQVAGLDYCGACRPAQGVGGDYFDFLLLPNETFGIAIGDVSGKGISAALLMASLQASLRGQAMQGTNDLASLMSNVNHLVYDASAENRYATFFYAQYEPATRQLTYVNAGHNPPIILRQSEGVWRTLRLEAGGLVVGLLRDYRYEQASVPLQSGDLLLAFTDGISEAMNTHEEEWGEQRLIETVRACAHLTAAEIIRCVMCAAGDFAAGAKQPDDLTLVVVRVL